MGTSSWSSNRWFQFQPIPMQTREHHLEEMATRESNRGVLLRLEPTTSEEEKMYSFRSQWNAVRWCAPLVAFHRVSERNCLVRFIVSNAPPTAALQVSERNFLVIRQAIIFHVPFCLSPLTFISTWLYSGIVYDGWCRQREHSQLFMQKICK